MWFEWLKGWGLSIFFFIVSCRLRALKTLYFCNFIKNIEINWYVVVVVLVLLGTHSKMSKNWKLSKLKVVRIETCQNWKLPKFESWQNWKWFQYFLPKVSIFDELNWKLPKLKVAKIESCQNWKLPKLKVAKIESSQFWKLPKLKTSC